MSDKGSYKILIKFEIATMNIYPNQLNILHFTTLIKSPVILCGEESN